jgi:hypothetical protein
MVTETGSGKTDYERTMSYASGPGGVSEEIAYNYAFSANRGTSIYSQDFIVSGWTRFPCEVESLDAGGNYSKFEYTFPNDTVSQGTLVKFTGKFAIFSTFH